MDTIVSVDDASEISKSPSLASAVLAPQLSPFSEPPSTRGVAAFSTSPDRAVSVTSSDGSPPLHQHQPLDQQQEHHQQTSPLVLMEGHGSPMGGGVSGFASGGASGAGGGAAGEAAGDHGDCDTLTLRASLFSSASGGPTPLVTTGGRPPLGVGDGSVSTTSLPVVTPLHAGTPAANVDTPSAVSFHTTDRLLPSTSLSLARRWLPLIVLAASLQTSPRDCCNEFAGVVVSELNRVSLCVSRGVRW